MRASENGPLWGLGWDADWEAAADAVAADGGVDGAIAGRVGRVDKGRVTVLTESGPTYAAPGAEHLATGDWVLLAGEPPDTQVAALLPRRTVFARGDSIEGVARGEQVLAANIDLVLILHTLTNGANARRLERELVLTFESGATPVVVLTKGDIVDEVTTETTIEAISASVMGVDVIVSSSRTGEGVDEIRALAHDNRTLALIGASGVGKSTLVNRLVGADVQDTGPVREGDQRGRHTTTARELVLLPGGGVLVDTPGLRAVSLWDADEGLSRAFVDIEELAAQCRFSDCSHTVEPGCAVQAAIESGVLDADRFENYRRLDAELDAAERKRKARILSKAQRKLYPRPLSANSWSRRGRRCRRAPAAGAARAGGTDARCDPRAAPLRSSATARPRGRRARNHRPRRRATPPLPRRSPRAPKPRVRLRLRSRSCGSVATPSPSRP